MAGVGPITRGYFYMKREREKNSAVPQHTDEYFTISRQIKEVEAELKEIKIILRELITSRKIEPFEVPNYIISKWMNW